MIPGFLGLLLNEPDAHSSLVGCIGVAIREVRGIQIVPPSLDHPNPGATEVSQLKADGRYRSSNAGELVCQLEGRRRGSTIAADIKAFCGDLDRLVHIALPDDFPFLGVAMEPPEISAKARRIHLKQPDQVPRLKLLHISIEGHAFSRYEKARARRAGRLYSVDEMPVATALPG